MSQGLGGLIPNAGDAVGDSDRGEIAAVTEGLIPNAGDALWNDD